MGWNQLSITDTGIFESKVKYGLNAEMILLIGGAAHRLVGGGYIKTWIKMCSLLRLKKIYFLQVGPIIDLWMEEIKLTNGSRLKLSVKLVEISSSFRY